MGEEFDERRGEQEAAAAGSQREPLGTNVRAAFSRARWALIGVALLIHLPYAGLAAFVGAPSEQPWATGLAMCAWVVLGFAGAREHAEHETRRLTVFLLGDVGLLTLLLSLSGAALNPFTMLYFVPIALSTLLPERATWTVVVAGVLGFCGLLSQTALLHLQYGHFFQHVVGMAIALALSGALVTYFVHLVARNLAAQQRRLRRLEQEQELNRVATSLGALAAGAAHELGTPLGTVQLLVGELGELNGDERSEAIRIIGAELSRIKKILHAMSSTELSAEQVLGGGAWGESELGAFVTSEFSERVDYEFSGYAFRTTQPREIVEQIVRELIKNASRTGSSVIEVRVIGLRTAFEVQVNDHGPGLTSEHLGQVFQPFVSFSGGRGLGLFLSLTHARQLGGDLVLSSKLGEGTRATLRLSLQSTLASGEAT